MQNNSPIAVFDSGVGGLSIYKEIKKLLPQEQTVYLADQKNCPYGTKSPAVVRSLTLKCLKYLKSLKPKLIIIACNTSTVSGIDFYRKQIPEIPIIGVVPVVKTAAEQTKNGHIAILSTMATARSKYQKELIARFCPDFSVINFLSSDSPDFFRFPDFPSRLILNLGCPNLVSFVERGITKGPQIEKELRQILAPVIAAKCDTLVLGCTHYPFLQKTIFKVFSENYKIYNLKSKILILDSGAAVARQAKRILEKNHALAVSPRKTEFSHGEFLTTGNHQKFKHAIEKLLGIKSQAHTIYF